MSRIPRTSVLIVLAAFLAGAGTGAGVMASYRRPPHRPPPPGAKDSRRLPPYLNRVDLTAEQRAQIEAIVDKYHSRFEAVFQESAPKLKTLRDELDAEIRPVLTPAQREQLEADRARHGPGPGFGPPPPPPPPR